MGKNRNYKHASFEWTWENEIYNEVTEDYETKELCTEVTVEFERDFDGWHGDITEGYYDIPEWQHDKIIEFAWDYADQD